MGVTVLVVDDESDLRYLLRRIFEKIGYVVLDAANGAAALELARASSPDLVVTDVMMPVMDGLELMRCLRAGAATVDIPILAISGDWQLASDADAVLAKPYDRDELIRVTENLIRNGRGER